MSLSQAAMDRLRAALRDQDVANELIAAINKTDVFTSGTGSAARGVFGVTAAARASAYTQTYSTADKTHANPTSATLTDSTGGSVSTTLAAMTNTTALTDNGGGTADGTVAAMTLPTALTDNGGGTADGTVASLAAATTLTDSTGLSGSHDDTLAATSVPADITGGEAPTEAEHNAHLAVSRVIAQNVSDVGQKVIELVAWQATVQNNFKEVTTWLAAGDTLVTGVKNNFKEVTTELATQRTLNAALITAVASLGDQVNKLRVDLLDAKQVVNSVIDDFQAYGDLQ